MTGFAQDWPPAVQVLNEGGTSDVVLICEHASNYIPAEYNRLGLPAWEIERHIAWDLGAAVLTERLSAALDAPAFLGAYSRLLVDLNRPLHTPSSNTVCSEDTDIPGNQDLDPTEIQRRAELIFHPFHDKISDHIDQRLRRHHPTRIVSVHTFTPVFRGHWRPWDAGVLYDQDHARAYGEQILACLAESRSLQVGANVPYKVTRADDYALYAHGADRGLSAVIIEIRQDLVGDSEGLDAWTSRLAHALSSHELERGTVA